MNDCKRTVSRKKWLKMIDFSLRSFIIICFALSLRASFYAESNGIFGNFLRRLLKISIQIKWMFQLKRDSLAWLVHNNLFRFVIMTTGCVLVCWIQWYFWKISTTIIKDFYTNKVNCVKQTNKRRGLPTVCTSVKAFTKAWNSFISFAQLNENLFIGIL